MPLLVHVAIDLASTDECTAVALRCLVHVAPVHSITGSPVTVKTLTETTETLDLGKIIVEMKISVSTLNRYTIYKIIWSRL